MTIAKTGNKVQYDGDGGTLPFAYAFRFFDNTDLEVILLDASNVETVQVLTTNYTVSNTGTEAGGTVTMIVAPAIGEKLTIVGAIPETQGTDYTGNDPFPAETHETALDRLTRIAQQDSEQADRSLRVTSSSANPPEFIPGPDQIIRTNASSTFEMVDLISSGLTVISGIVVFEVATVADLIADTDLGYSAGAVVQVSVGDIVNAGGFRYIVVASGGDIQNSNATPVRMDVIQTASGVFNVAAYGAPNDGIADASPATQVAVDALIAEGGGVLLFPRGAFLFDTGIILGTAVNAVAVRIVGQGTGPINDRTSHITRILNNQNGDAFTCRTLGGFTVENISIQDNLGAGPRTVGAGIFVDRDPDDGNTQLNMNNVFISGHQDGVRAVRPLVSNLKSVICSVNERDGFRLEPTVGGSGTSVLFDNCFAIGNGNDGFAVDGYSYISFLATACDNSGRYGYYVDNVGGSNPTGISFFGAGAENNTDDNVHIANSTAISIVGGSLVTSGADGIHLDTCRGVCISGVKLSANTGYGINISGGSEITIISPHFIANTAGTINDPANLAVTVNAPTTRTGFGATPGLATAPSFYFGSDPDTGFYSIANNQLGVTVGGGRIVRATTSSWGSADAGVTDLGGGGGVWKRVFLDQYVESNETTNPGPGAANKGRYYFKDNGSGKMLFIVQFPTGGEIVLATEP